MSSVFSLIAGSDEYELETKGVYASRELAERDILAAAKAGEGWTHADVHESPLVGATRIEIPAQNPKGLPPIGTLGDLWDARPEDMPVIEWSTKVAAVVEAARIYVAGSGKAAELTANWEALLGAVRALEGRS